MVQPPSYRMFKSSDYTGLRDWQQEGHNLRDLCPDPEKACTSLRAQSVMVRLDHFKTAVIESPFDNATLLAVICHFA